MDKLLGSCCQKDSMNLLCKLWGSCFPQDNRNLQDKIGKQKNYLLLLCLKK